MPSRETLQRLVALVESNAHVDAIEQFYAENASMRENMGEPKVGRALLMERERKTMSRAKSIKSTLVPPVLASGDVVVARWIFEFEWLDGRRTRLEELSWQRWEGERIVEEQFFYDPAQVKK